MKILLIIIDGLGDKPITELDNRTPLGAAKTPNLDWLAENGICGKVLPFWFDWQKYPRSDTAHLAIFGYNPEKYYLGRGVYEVVGNGMQLKKGDVALRVNFATISKNLKIIDRRAGRINKTGLLIKSLQGIKIEGVKFLIKKSYGHRAGLILRGKNLSAKISDSDPHRIGARVKKILPLNKSKQAKWTAKVLNEFLEKAHQILESHSLNKKRIKRGLLLANCLLVRGAGIFKKTPSFQEKYRLKAGFIAGGGLYKGIGKILGMNEIKVRGDNGLANTNLRGKFLAARKALKKYDFIFLHIKAADNFAEDGNFLGKKKFIEKIDKSLKPVLKLKDALIVGTADHSTCCKLKRHCLEPVPVFIFGHGADSVKEFSEKACKKGKLGKIKQLNLMKKILVYTK
jgi:2,3-bisphosphoglycerate-independent phosphoglycerate mutase